MVLPFETVSTEDRRVERERQRRLVFALSRSDPTADCLAAMATNLLDHQFRLEEAVLAAAADAPPPADRLVIFLAAIRAALPEATALFRQAYAAAHPVFAVVLYFYFQIVLLFEAASPEDRSVQRERHDAWSG